ncbi:MAG: thiamine phosphate synthase [Ruminococcus flavefaciens]|nr:thiamine phosphate synthase [Ruminococcus flavefaciens]MCM1229158.1 thiamine phosphate synthase [Ruminococcus flavefaciens]
MFKIICVTDRKSCREDFITRIEKIAAAKPDRIIFRDKDCGDEEYVKFACKVLEISGKYGVPCSRYFHPDFTGDTHMTMPMLQHIPLNEMNYLRVIGASVHSVEEAVEAESKGVDYVIAGHIFETSCKPDLAPRGLDFLCEVCKSVKIPVYAIGGINPQNINQVVQAGAGGACIMSGFMSCENPAEFMESLRKGAEINGI